jgi:predicted SAM-dependent methyltransferase
VLPVTPVEPNPTPVPGCKARIIKGFFDENFKLEEEVDAVVHSHVFEHMYDPSVFVEHLAGFLVPGKKLIFSVPNMRVMVDRKYTNCLNFEHTIFLTEEYIEHLLARHGFRVIEREYFQDDHSIFYAAVRDSHVATKKIPASADERNRDAYLAYVEEHHQLIRSVNEDIRGRSNVFLFGAHAQGQYLIGFGLDTGSIEAMLDNDANKHGMRLYGTNKIVHGPQILAGRNEPTVIVRAGTFTKEIVEQIRGINPSTRFLL